MTLYLIRHAHAGKKHTWSGPDEQRPLSAKGQAQAERIADQFADLGIKRVISSPAVRCRETVEPLAARLGLHVKEDERLAEGAPTGPALKLLRDLAAADRDVALCSHGDLIPALMSALDLTGDGHLASAKAGAFILEIDGGRIRHALYVPPPGVHVHSD